MSLSEWLRLGRTYHQRVYWSHSQRQVSAELRVGQTKIINPTIIPRLRLPSRTYLVWSYMSCVPLAEHSEGKYNSLSVICITLRPHSFHFIQIEPTHGLTGVYSIVNSSFSNPLSQYVLYYHRRNKMSRENMQ